MRFARLAKSKEKANENRNEPHKNPNAPDAPPQKARTAITQTDDARENARGAFCESTIALPSDATIIRIGRTCRGCSLQRTQGEQA